MDLQNSWQLQPSEDAFLAQVIQRQQFDRVKSKLPLRKLKSSLLSGMLLAALITAAYVYLAFSFAVWQVRLALAVLLLFNGWVLFDSVRLYKSIAVFIAPHLSLKAELERHVNSFENWWRIQKKVSLFVFPVATAGGFILGGVLGSGKPVADFLYNPRMLLFLLITVVAIAPLCYRLARWMFHYSYGKYLDELRRAIAELSEE